MLDFETMRVHGVGISLFDFARRVVAVLGDDLVLEGLSLFVNDAKRLAGLLARVENRRVAEPGMRGPVR